MNTLKKIGKLHTNLKKKESINLRGSVENRVSIRLTVFCNCYQQLENFCNCYKSIHDSGLRYPISTIPSRLNYVKLNFKLFHSSKSILTQVKWVYYVPFSLSMQEISTTAYMQYLSMMQEISTTTYMYHLDSVSKDPLKQETSEI